MLELSQEIIRGLAKFFKCLTNANDAEELKPVPWSNQKKKFNERNIRKPQKTLSEKK